jgi:hypothetical protein
VRAVMGFAKRIRPDGPAPLGSTHPTDPFPGNGRPSTAGSIIPASNANFIALIKDL